MEGPSRWFKAQFYASKAPAKYSWRRAWGDRAWEVCLFVGPGDPGHRAESPISNKAIDQGLM